MKQNLLFLGGGFLSGAGATALAYTLLIFSPPSSVESPASAPAVPVVRTAPAVHASPESTRPALEPDPVEVAAPSAAPVAGDAEPPQVVTVEAETVVEAVPLAPEIVAERRARFLAMAQERRAAERAADRERCDFLTSVDPALLTEEQTGSHQAYAQLAVRCGEIRELLADQAGELSAEERAALQREFRETQQALAAHAVTERQALFEAVARAMGLEGEEPAAFAETMFQVISVTEPPRNPSHRRPGRRR